MQHRHGEMEALQALEVSNVKRTKNASLLSSTTLGIHMEGIGLLDAPNVKKNQCFV